MEAIGYDTNCYFHKDDGTETDKGTLNKNKIGIAILTQIANVTACEASFFLCVNKTFSLAAKNSLIVEIEKLAKLCPTFAAIVSRDKKRGAPSTKTFIHILNHLQDAAKLLDCAVNLPINVELKNWERSQCAALLTSLNAFVSTTFQLEDFIAFGKMSYELNRDFSFEKLDKNNPNVCIKTMLKLFVNKDKIDNFLKTARTILDQVAFLRDEIGGVDFFPACDARDKITPKLLKKILFLYEKSKEMKKTEQFVALFKSIGRFGEFVIRVDNFYRNIYG